MPRQPAPEERFASEVLRRSIGATFTGFDDGTAPRMVDGLFTLPDGTLGAVEVTTLGDQAALQVEGISATQDWSIEGALLAWRVETTSTTNMADLRRHLRTLALRCEAEGCTQPEHLPSTDDEALRWYRSSGVRMFGFATASHAGFVDLSPGMRAAFVDEQLVGLPGWLGAELRKPKLQPKIAKLSRTGRAERHLFLRLHESAIPDPLFPSLTFDEATPSAPLDLPAELTAVWLAARFGSPLWWSNSAGWQRAEVLG